jgi:lysophospholipase L1-like esterase
MLNLYRPELPRYLRAALLPALLALGSSTTFGNLEAAAPKAAAPKPAAAKTGEATPYPPAACKRILFLGDSITYAGHYVARVDAFLRAARPDVQWEILNLGLPSETCTGLSEPDHPFPRPDVHERLERALQKYKPDLVVACYGMNDGIYYPFSEERFAAYQKGIGRLIDTVRSTDARLVLMTPPPFDPLPLKLKGNLRPRDAEKFAWFAIYEDYDDVMRQYAAWLRTQADRVDMVVDLHTPVSEFVLAKRKTEREFSMSPDGVHLNRQGHDLLAETILRTWGYPTDQSLPPRLLELAEQREVLLRDAWLSHVGHKRPGTKAGPPLDEATTKAAELEKLMDPLTHPQ